MTSKAIRQIGRICWVVSITVISLPTINAQNTNGVVPPCTTFPTIAPEGTQPCGDAVQPKQVSQDAQEQPTPEPSPAPSQTMWQSAHVVQSLDGEPVIEPKPTHGEFLYGGRLIAGWDSAAIGPNSTLKSTVFSTYDGYLGAALQTRKSYFVVQQDAFGNEYTASGLPGQFLFQTSVLGAGEWTTRTKWHIEGSSTEGDGALLFLSPLPSTTVGSSVATLPTSADLGLDNSFAWYPLVSGGVNLALTPATTLVLYAKDSYRDIFDNNTHDNVAVARPSLQFAVTNRTSVGVYGMSTRETGEIDCRSNGGGLELSTHFGRTGYLDAWGGPQYGSAGCVRQQNFEYHLEVSTQLSRRIDAYLIANRESGNTLVSGSDWEDNVALGIKRHFARSIVLTLDGGYVNGVHLGSTINYQGAFGAVELRKRISNSFLISGAYRRFDNNETAPALHRNVVLFSIIFSPARRVGRRN